MGIDEYLLKKPYFSKLGDVIDYSKPRMAWKDINRQDQIGDILQILNKQRQFNPSFNNLVFQ